MVKVTHKPASRRDHFVEVDGESVIYGELKCVREASRVPGHSAGVICCGDVTRVVMLLAS